MRSHAPRADSAVPLPVLVLRNETITRLVVVRNRLAESLEVDDSRLGAAKRDVERSAVKLELAGALDLQVKVNASPRDLSFPYE